MYLPIPLLRDRLDDDLLAAHRDSVGTLMSTECHRTHTLLFRSGFAASPIAAQDRVPMTADLRVANINAF
jgi:hypothetical protein